LNHHLHIVCLDNPDPPDYGGAIEMFYKITALYERGIKIHLHYFDYSDRENTGKISNYCETIHSYKRKTAFQGFSLKLPYIVASRINKELIAQLKKDNHPVLAEGIHCTGILSHLDTTTRKIVVRLHNDESVYYNELANSTQNIYKKTFFKNESKLLNKYQKELSDKYIYVCISEKDAATFKSQYHLNHVEYIPAFTAWQKVVGRTGLGDYCLYQGNLSVPENEKAITWLITEVLPGINMPIVIAGKNASESLEALIRKQVRCRLISNPGNDELNELIQKAHINLLPSFNTTGIKLKLLHALFEGRHCIANNAMIEGTGLEPICHIATTSKEFIKEITKLSDQQFEEEDITLRTELLESIFNNKVNAEKIIQLIW
jgi:glycosyltransferase involved in cell wall biosynthesis